MAQLVIKGHPTREKEVIEILEMLGGENKQGHCGNNPNVAYYISHENTIVCDWERYGYTLEEFLEKFPYKVGDKVHNIIYNEYQIITDLFWDSQENEVLYQTNNDEYLYVNYIQPYKEETMEENLTIQDIRDNNAEWLLNKLQEMSSESALQTINDLYGELHKPQYPKTYEECCKVLSLGEDGRLYTKGYKASLIQEFQQLLICRDAYWKIIGEQMGLDKPWAPVYTDDNIKYSITTHKNRLDFNGTIERNYVLIFPTKEIKNAFYENFKELIEKCKELL